MTGTGGQVENGNQGARGRGDVAEGMDRDAECDNGKVL